MDLGISKALELFYMHRPDTLPTVVAAILEESLDSFDPIAVCSGVKCVADAKLAGAQPSELALKACLRDMHAEVLAVCTLIYMLKLNLVQADSRFWLWISETPCGDASIIPDIDSDRFVPITDGVVRGHAGWNLLGCTRSKPARGDAPDARLMSCSDLLGRWSILGITPGIYLAGLILNIKNDDVDGRKLAVQRSFHQRLTLVRESFTNAPEIDIQYISVSLDFDATDAMSPTAMIWHKGIQNPEYIVNGFKQGASLKKLCKAHCSCIVSEDIFDPEDLHLFHSIPPFDKWLW